MTASKGGSSKGGHMKGARSVGAAAAGGTKPAGAILDDGEEYFRKWAKSYREKKLKANAHEKLYPQPVQWKMD